MSKERSKRLRDRRRRGVLLMAPIEITETGVARLIERGYLSGVTGDGEVRVKRDEVIHAVQRAFDDWAA